MQPMQLVALGLNHHTAPIAIRERLAFQPERLVAALGELVRLPSVQEAAIVSTCNRTELYCATRDPQEAADWLAAYHRLSLPDISPYLYSHPDNDAVRHVFRVASGLDSMVLGEPQILGQLKEAVRLADSAGSLGSTLHRLFQKSFSVAKEVRSTTAIGESVVSMAAAAVRLSERIFGDMRETRVLFVGAGEMIALAAAHFAGSSPQRMSIANRTIARAEQLAERVRGDAMSLASVGERLADYDVVVSVHRQPAAHHWLRHGRARAQGTAATPDGDGRSGRAARHRTRSCAAVQRVLVYRSMISCRSCRRARPHARLPCRMLKS